LKEKCCVHFLCTFSEVASIFKGWFLPNATMLARTEAAIAIRSVFERFPKLRLKNQTANWDSEKRNIRAQRTLPVLW